jgi:hypothetical protein
MEPKKDILAEVDLPALYAKREEAVKKQKEAAKDVELGKARHLFLYLLAAGAIVLVAVLTTPVLHDYDATGLIIIALAAAACIAAFFPDLRLLQDKAAAANKSVRDIEADIAFGHRVQEEVRTIRVRKYAEAWLQKEMS